MNNARRVRTAIFLLISASFPAAAEEVAPTPPPEPAPEVAPAATPVTEAPAVVTPAETAPSVAAPPAAVVVDNAVEATVEAPAKKGAPYRGTSIGYGLTTVPARTFDPSFQKTYQPTLMHQLDLRPEWHVGSQFYLRARFLLAQEFFTGNASTYNNQVVYSDPSLDLGMAGIEDPFAKIKVAGSLRLIGGVSKSSTSETKIVTLAPGLSLSRSFKVLSGIQVRYDGRLGKHFHRFTTRQNQGPDVAALCAPGDISCHANSTGDLNTHTDIVHGPAVAISPTEKLSFSSSFLMYRGWRYAPSPSEFDGVMYNPQVDSGTSNAWGLSAGASYQLIPELSLSLSGSSFAGQLQGDSTRQNPFLNRYTNLSLELGLDVESLLQRI